MRQLFTGALSICLLQACAVLEAPRFDISAELRDEIQSQCWSDYPDTLPADPPDRACIQREIAQARAAELLSLSGKASRQDYRADLVLFSLLFAQGGAVLADSHSSLLEGLVYGAASFKALKALVNPAAKYTVFDTGAARARCVAEVGATYIPIMERWASLDWSSMDKAIGVLFDSFSDQAQRRTADGYTQAPRVAYQLEFERLYALKSLREQGAEAYRALPEKMAASLRSIETEVTRGVHQATGDVDALGAGLLEKAKEIVAARTTQQDAEMALDDAIAREVARLAPLLIEGKVAAEVCAGD